MKSAKNQIVKILPVLALIMVFQSVIATSPQFDGTADARTVQTQTA